MSKPSLEKGAREDHTVAPQAQILDSGIIPRCVLDERPPWRTVEEYLETGAQRAWVESYAARSPGFAYVLEMKKNARAAREERLPEEEAELAEVIPIR